MRIRHIQAYTQRGPSFQRIEATKAQAEIAAKAEVDATALTEVMENHKTPQDKNAAQVVNPYAQYKEQIRILNSKAPSLPSSSSSAEAGWSGCNKHVHMS